jgi:hypothetical protein
VVPVAHAHIPPVHTWRAEQAWPQVPQLAGSVVAFTQAPPHTTWPCAHWQTPVVHARPAGQAAPQVPQFCGSPDRFTQR